MLLSNADKLILSVKPLVIVFSKKILKKIFRIYNIKLYKLMVKKPLMQIKFILNIKKIKVK